MRPRPGQADRSAQQERFAGLKKINCNADMGSKETQAYCEMEREAQDMLKMAISDMHFSARAYDRILKVSRTIADLAGAERIDPLHVSEAIQYRTLDRQLWI